MHDTIENSDQPAMKTRAAVPRSLTRGKRGNRGDRGQRIAWSSREARPGTSGSEVCPHCARNFLSSTMLARRGVLYCVEGFAQFGRDDAARREAWETFKRTSACPCGTGKPHAFRSAFAS